MYVLEQQQDEEGNPVGPKTPEVAPELQIMMTLAVGGDIPDEWVQDIEDFQPQEMVIDSVTVYQPSPCPAGYTNHSPQGYQGYRCTK